jgi:hypothetical protein
MECPKCGKNMTLVFTNEAGDVYGCECGFRHGFLKRKED